MNSLKLTNSPEIQTTAPVVVENFLFKKFSNNLKDDEIYTSEKFINEKF